MSKTWVKMAKYKKGNGNVHILCIIFVYLADIIMRLHMESNFTASLKTHVHIHSSYIGVLRIEVKWKCCFEKRTERNRGSCQRQHRPTKYKKGFEWKRKNKGILEEYTHILPTWRSAWYDDDDVNVDGCEGRDRVIIMHVSTEIYNVKSP